MTKSIATKEDWQLVVAQRLVAARQFRGWDQQTLAARSGLVSQRIGECETTGDLYCDELIVLAEALELPISHFVRQCVLCGHAADD